MEIWAVVLYVSTVLQITMNGGQPVPTRVGVGVQVTPFKNQKAAVKYYLEHNNKDLPSGSVRAELVLMKDGETLKMVCDDKGACKKGE